ncbi:hypothetical protein EN833_07710 [Mesorhizobium sp. M4B.F.Ca.ET.190.01.1.1]|uniref:hypothetical protein n=1 Tax=unclassified Mesorhizobium TaxID=325217 RepID=UPI001091B104|nr:MULTISPECIES: hypothetical protein [unclassified Mesorhizobium]TGR13053.1 hypothetical protein EN843_07705 [Mesorhizobium sp. M4B.F.Ca.ET.200.01.1.1]TGS21264.1 hypothetical protein EN833_07710 [Mesorhizobium sp. M4B.F.Ca.ET.190.01.1.1]TGT32827.1 hypothetical protein EN815_10250 [Mesorhizobium sp. M4B.F.Ca.ET.172.01.1.1]
MIDTLKLIGALLCAAGLMVLIYVHSSEERYRDFTRWISSEGQSAGSCTSIGEGLRCVLPAAKEALPYLSILSSFIAAGLGIRAATYVIRDSMDDFMNDIAQQGRWASWAAVAAGLSVVLQALDRLWQ